MTEKEKIRHIFHKLCDLETSAKAIRGVYWQSPHTMTQRVYGSMHLSDVRPSVRPSVTTGDAKRRIKYIQSDSPDGSTNFTPRRLLKMAHRGQHRSGGESEIYDCLDMHGTRVSERRSA